jgi:hypothetical protein
LQQVIGIGFPIGTGQSGQVQPWLIGFFFVGFDAKVPVHINVKGIDHHDTNTQGQHTYNYDNGMIPVQYVVLCWYSNMAMGRKQETSKGIIVEIKQ